MQVSEPEFSFEEATPDLISAIELVVQATKNARFSDSLCETLGIYNALYDPSLSLKRLIASYNSIFDPISGGKTKVAYTTGDAGKIMEQIAYLAFRCLKGLEVFKSFRSAESQIDLVITIDPLSLLSFTLPLKTNKIIVEAKNEDEAISVKSFSRLAALLTYKYSDQSRLGIFFARKGASGFPQHGQPRQRTLNDSRAIQVIYHAKTDKYLIVFDHDDIQLLQQPGALIRLIRSKISDVEDLSGIDLEYDGNVEELDDLPPHLAKLSY